MSVPIVNHIDYQAKIDENSNFPIQKFTALANYLSDNKIVNKFFTPEACSVETLKNVIYNY